MGLVGSKNASDASSIQAIHTHTQRKGGYASQIVRQEFSEVAALHLSSARSSCKDKKLP